LRGSGQRGGPGKKRGSVCARGEAKMAARQGGVFVTSKRSDGTIEKELFSPQCMKQNAMAITNGRTVTAIAGGIFSGILGLTGLQGALCYFLYMALFSATLLMKLGLKYQPYFTSW